MSSVITVENLSKKYIIGHQKIFLNGAILGMSKAEIKSKFDEIVVFAKLKKFLIHPSSITPEACSQS
ncbi:MAG: hypothetical protein ABL858_02075 [Candidatus Nitrotoga sp.]